MNYDQTVVARVAAPVVELEDMKADLDVDFADDDDLIQSHIDSAISWVEEHTNRFLQPVTIDLWTGSLTGKVLRLPSAPVRSVSTISVDGVAISGFQGLPGYHYTVLPPAGSYWPLTVDMAGTRVNYEAGYVAGTVPEGLKAAVKAVVGIYYNKPTGNELTAEWNAVERSLTPFRVRSL